MSNQRLKTAFHETFSLSRESVRQVLVAFDGHTDLDGSSSAAERERLLRKNTDLGTRYVKAMPRFAVGVGVLQSDYSISALGRAILRSDCLVEKPDTLWLFHYFMSAPNGPGPLFWHKFVTRFFRTGTEFAQNKIEGVIAECSIQDHGRTLAKRTVNDTASMFLRTYTKEESLGSLKILDLVPTSGCHRVLDPEPPSAWAFGYALLHYWRTVYGNVLTINLDLLHTEGGLGSIFLCGSGRVNRMLTTLQMEGFVDIYRVAPPFQVVLLRPDPEALLEKIYASFDTN